MPRLYEVNNSIIVRNVQQTFDIDDIDKVWSYLGKKFGFNLIAWRNEFGDYFNPHDRDKNIQTQFMEYGKKNIEPLLNEILKRERYPTWIHLLAYLLKDKIEQRNKRDQFYRGRFNK